MPILVRSTIVPKSIRSLVLLLLLHLAAATGSAELVVTPMQFDLDVEVGTNPPPVFVNIENIGPNTTVANFGSSDNGIAIATVNELSIAAGESALLQVNILTSFNPRGRYRDSIPVWEQDPTKQAAPTYNVEFNFNLFQPGPASIVSFSYSADPIEILPDGIALAEGSYLALLIDVSGTPPIEYVWQFSTDKDIWQPVQDGPEVFGLGEDTLGFEFMSIARSGYYRCAVSNDGIGGDTSSAFFVRVDPQPPMITQPESISVFEGATASFHVTAESYSAVFYQWRFAADGFIFRDLTSSDVGIAGHDSPNLTIMSASAANQGSYRCLLTNSGPEVESDIATLTVLPAPPELVVDPEAVTHFVAAGLPYPKAMLKLRNSGGGEMTFSFAATEEPWLGSATPSSGTIAAGAERTIEFTIFNTGLPFGEYPTFLSLTTDALGRENVSIPLTLVIASQFAVTSLVDTGPGTLRALISLVNLTPGPQTITFAVSGTIKVESALPPLSDPTGGTILDGEGKIQIDGHLLRGFENGLLITSANNEIRNIGIVRFPANGILVTRASARSNLIVQCRIGTDGTMDLGNFQSGIRLDGDSFGTVIGGESDLANVISGNSFSGIAIGQSSGNVVSGNFIGTGDRGAGFIGNGGNGFQILPATSSDNTIGGDVLFDANVIGRNAFFGGALDVLVGRTVRLRALVHGDESYDYQWYRSSGPVGSGRELVLANVQKGDSDSYYCEVSNEDGVTESKRTFVNVLTREEFVALGLLPSYSGLDENGDGGLDFSEASGSANRALQKVQKGTSGGGPLTLAEFNALDLNRDGLLTFQELLAASGISLEEVRYEVSPASYLFPPQDIDEGIAGTQSFTITNLELESLEVLTSPTMTGPAAAEFALANDTGGMNLGFFQERQVQAVSDPAFLNDRVAYLTIRTDDFLLPTYYLMLSGFGSQSTRELLDTLLRINPAPRQRGELDVNEDLGFDASDIRSNSNTGF